MKLDTMSATHTVIDLGGQRGQRPKPYMVFLSVAHPTPCVMAPEDLQKTLGIHWILLENYWKSNLHCDPSSSVSGYHMFLSTTHLQIL